ncbi:DUF4174 domain-containing protein [Kordia jejudonensis]|uniref:DUF4174 domain-containing protein n=1 Tax=Kordia jejudonensis TaxID=1348245 RepID=UPI000629B924|nr:DUF4174 domain-containing protein [Kordia jejudonensis]
MNIYKQFIIIISLFSFMTIHAQDLENHRWEDRILIIKTTSIASKTYQAQRKQFEASQEALKERKFVVYTIIGEDFELINYQNRKLNTSGKITGKLAKILHNNEDFEVILIGLDGGIKLRQTKILTKEELFRIIDSMPMRRSEMRKKKTKS